MEISPFQRKHCKKTVIVNRILLHLLLKNSQWLLGETATVPSNSPVNINWCSNRVFQCFVLICILHQCNYLFRVIIVWRRVLFAEVFLEITIECEEDLYSENVSQCNKTLYIVKRFLFNSMNPSVNLLRNSTCSIVTS